MRAFKVFLTARAEAETDDYLAYYLQNAPEGVAERFDADIEDVKNRLAHFPYTGSPRYEYLLPSVRFVHVGRFPFLAFYVIRGQTVKVFRILHESRDIDTALSN